jgi:hypothetical protein
VIAVPPLSIACGVNSAPAKKPAPISIASAIPSGRACAPGPGVAGPRISGPVGAGSSLPNTTGAASGSSVVGAIAAGAAGMGVALAVARSRGRRADTAASGADDPGPGVDRGLAPS